MADPGVLPATVSTISSQDEVEGQKLIGSVTDDFKDNDICWVSAVKCEYPQDVVLVLSQVSHVKCIQILFHEAFTPTTITLLAGVPDQLHYSKPDAAHAIFKELGSISVSEGSGDPQSREVKNLNVDVNALFVRLILDENHRSGQNPGNQVGIVAVRILGFPGRGDIRDEANSYAMATYDDSSGEDDAFLSGLLNRVSKKVSRLEGENDQLDDDEKKRAKANKGKVSGGRYTFSARDRSSTSSRKRPDSNASSRPPSTRRSTSRSSSSRSKTSQGSRDKNKDDGRPLTSRTKARIIKEIMDAPLSDDENDIGRGSRKGGGGAGSSSGAASSSSAATGGKSKKTPLRFQTKLGEFNNTMRLLKVKKTEAVWNEDYEKAEAIANVLNKMKESEEEMTEWLDKRREALEAKDFGMAAQCKKEFELLRDDALQLKELDELLSADERKFLKAKADDEPKSGTADGEEKKKKKKKKKRDKEDAESATSPTPDDPEVN